MSIQIEHHTKILDDAVSATAELCEKCEERLKRNPNDILETNIICAFNDSRASIIRFKYAFVRAKGQFKDIPEQHRANYLQAAHVLDALSMLILETMPRMNPMQRKFYDKILALSNSLSLSIRSHFTSYGLESISIICKDAVEKMGLEETVSMKESEEKPSPQLKICGGIDYEKKRVRKKRVVTADTAE